MKLIDDDENEKRLNEEREYLLIDDIRSYVSVPTITVAQGIEMIKSLPTADVVEIVRCKDCVYYLNSSEKCDLIDTRLHFYETANTWTGDCFCCWGERRVKDG